MSQELQDALNRFLDAPIASTMKRLRMPVATDLAGATTLRTILIQPNPPRALVKQLIDATEIDNADRIGLPEPVLQIVHLAAIAVAILHRKIGVKDDGPVRESLKQGLRRDWLSPDLVELFDSTLRFLDGGSSS